MTFVWIMVVAGIAYLLCHNLAHGRAAWRFA